MECCNYAHAYEDSEEAVSFTSSFVHGWKDRCRRSLYSVFLAGAVLYREYHEPWVMVPSSGAPGNILQTFRKAFAHWKFDQRGQVPLPWESVLPAEAECLRTFPVYDYNAHEEHHTGFGPLAALFEKEALQSQHEIF